MKNFISVIIPAYNAENTIAQTIESALGQTHQNFEIIIIDDKSKDSTADIIESYAETDSRIKFIRNEKNLGASVSRCRGIEQASYEWVALLDSDDCWHKDKLEIQNDYINANKDKELFYTAIDYVNEKGHRYKYIFHVPEEITYKELLKQNVIACSSVIVKKSVINKYPMIDDRNIHEDFLCWASMLKDGIKAMGINQPLLTYRLSSKGKSGNKFKSAIMNYRTHRFLGLPHIQTICSMWFYTLRNLKKYSLIMKSKEQNDIC